MDDLIPILHHYMTLILEIILYKANLSTVISTHLISSHEEEMLMALIVSLHISLRSLHYRKEVIQSQAHIEELQYNRNQLATNVHFYITTYKYFMII
jgi:hypothetical protein